MHSSFQFNWFNYAIFADFSLLRLFFFCLPFFGHQPQRNSLAIFRFFPFRSLFTLSWHWTRTSINHPVLKTFPKDFNNPGWDLSVRRSPPLSISLYHFSSLPPCPKLSSRPSVMLCLWALLLLCPDDHCHRELPITDAAWWTMLPRRAADTPVSLAAETLPL